MKKENPYIPPKSSAVSNDENISREIKKAAIAIRSTGNLGAFSFFVPFFLIFSLPLSFVALHRRKKILRNSEMVSILNKQKSLKKKELHKLKKEDTLDGSAALFLLHHNSAFNSIFAAGAWTIFTIVALVAF